MSPILISHGAFLVRPKVALHGTFIQYIRISHVSYLLHYVPEPWMLTYTDIVVPSLHRQEGRQYDGEVVMSHVYSVEKEGKRVRCTYINRICVIVLMMTSLLTPSFAFLG